VDTWNGNFPARNTDVKYVVLRTTWIKNVKFKIVNIRTGCQFVDYFYYSENLNRAAQNLWQGRMRPADCTSLFYKNLTSWV